MKTVIEMAREAGAYPAASTPHALLLMSESQIEHFAELVRSDERDRAMRENAYVLAEREACAGLCDRFSNRMMTADECAAAIRARGEA